jgi:hypothetical protein
MANGEETESVQSAEETAEQRRLRRRRVLKRAQLIFGISGSTIDCLVLDESRFGVQLETPLMTPLPDHLRIRFANGAIYDAMRSWSAGNKLGLEYVGSQIYDEATLRQRKAVRLTLKTQGLQVALHMLRDFEFFKDDDLRQAAEAAELALSRLSGLLDLSGDM